MDKMRGQNNGTIALALKNIIWNAHPITLFDKIKKKNVISPSSRHYVLSLVEDVSAQKRGNFILYRAAKGHLKVKNLVKSGKI
jgi:hypothetical protein